ncbi:histidine phosphatase family protein [Ruegeria sp. HKCCA5426]|uniref:histidine phosphatase family protein n=1 Tax=Ruegeria sp. HKCCA5426 TaxID=2682985 RepID=UPI00148854E0|nr:histidine phosphatase family protein [Ruegeria sp. HKCCA5426]
MTKEFRQHVFVPPAGAADILLVRHGESEPAIPGKPFPLKDGHGDPALHPNGESQAEAVAARLKSVPFSAVYVTTLRRTRQTAAPLLEHLALEPIEERDLREVFLGDWDGGEYRIRAAERHPAFQCAEASHEWGEIPGAETTAQFTGRVRAGLLRIAAAHPDQRVAAFVHGGVIAAAMSIATGVPAMTFLGAANGSFTRLVIHGDKMVVRGYNDMAHLE